MKTFLRHHATLVSALAAGLVLVPVPAPAALVVLVATGLVAAVRWVRRDSLAAWPPTTTTRPVGPGGSSSYVWRWDQNG
jgi:hypothetical protein